MLLRFTSNLIMQLTKDCNLHCKYCFQGKKSEWKDKQVSFEDFIRIVDTTIYERCVLGTIESPIDFHFHGGEITLIEWPILKEMILYIENRRNHFPGISMCIQTNGLNLNEEMCTFFKEHNVSVGISFDGFHTDDRMSIEATENLMKKIKDLHEKTGCYFGTLSVFSRKNMKTWLEDIKKIKSYILAPGINPICTREDQDDLIPSPEEQWTYWIEPVLKSYLTEDPLRERDIDIALTKVLNDIIFQSKNSTCEKTGCFDRICGHGANMIAIDPNLNVYNCDKYLEEGKYIDSRKGYALEQRDFLGLQQINNVVKFYREIRSLEKKEGCDFCKAKRLCVGECQSYAISKYGKYKINSEMCDIYKRAYDFISDNWIQIIKHGFNINEKVQDIKSEALRVLEEHSMTICVDFDNRTYRGVEK